MGPLTRSKSGNIFLLVIQDVFTKYALIHPVRTATSKEVVKYLENRVFMSFGVPEVIISDNGSHFKSEERSDEVTKGV